MKSKHCFRRFAAALACLMLCVFCMPHTAFAKSYSVLPDEGKPCSIELAYRVDGEPVEGMEYRLYRVATMNKNVQLDLTEKFADLQPLRAEGMDLRNLPASLNTTWVELAETLYQNLGDMEPDAAATTKENGITKAENLEMGLWLVVGETHHVGTADDGTEIYYRPVPFLVALPSWIESENRWDPDVSVASKPMTSLTARRVLKVWDDGGSRDVEHPDVTVQLMRNGVDYGEPVTLNAGNNWRHDFGELEGSDGTNPIQWTIRETTDLGGKFTVSISQQGITFVVTNTYDPPVQPPPVRPEPSPSPAPSPDPSSGPSPAPSPDSSLSPSPAPSPDPSSSPFPEPSSSPAPGPSPSPEPDEPEPPPEEIDDPDIPQADLPPSPEEIDDPSVPQGQPDLDPEPDPGDEPGVPSPDPDGPGDPDEIDDPDVPLGDLPQTGQLWWPVPVLAAAGVMMFLFGLKRRSGANYEE